jgi:hypothetical protein
MFGTVILMAKGVRAHSSVNPFHLDEATISDVHAAYKSGALTSVMLVQAYLERIRACDQAGPKLNEFLGRPWSEKLLVEIGFGYPSTAVLRPPYRRCSRRGYPR